MPGDSAQGNRCESKKRKLLRQIRKIYSSLTGIVSEVTLRRSVAAASILALGLGCSDPGQHGNPDGETDTTSDPTADSTFDPSDDESTDPATDGITPVVPSFAAPINLPGLEAPSGYYVWHVFADIDGDGDFDLFAGTYEPYTSTGLYYFENSGSPSSPTFESAVENPFGFTSSADRIMPAAADMDGDGDLDFLVGALSTAEAWFEYFENTGTSLAPVLATGARDPFGLGAGTSLVPNLSTVDIDDDGDVDILIGHYLDSANSILFLENTGSATSPAYTAPSTSPFGLSAPTEYTPFLAPVDLDLDGDIDVMIGAYGHPTDSGLFYFENTGTPSDPSFASPVHNPFGITTTRYVSSPAFADLDSDGDMDLLVATYRYGDDAIFQYFENTSL